MWFSSSSSASSVALLVVVLLLPFPLGVVCCGVAGREKSIPGVVSITVSWKQKRGGGKVSQCRVLGKDLIVLLTDIWWCWEFVSGEDVSVVLLGLAANSTVIGGGSWFMIRIIIGNWLFYIWAHSLCLLRQTITVELIGSRKISVSFSPLSIPLPSTPPLLIAC